MLIYADPATGITRHMKPEFAVVNRFLTPIMATPTARVLATRQDLYELEVDTIKNEIVHIAEGVGEGTHFNRVPIEVVD